MKEISKAPSFQNFPQALLEEESKLASTVLSPLPASSLGEFPHLRGPRASAPVQSTETIRSSLLISRVGETEAQGGRHLRKNI